MTTEYTLPLSYSYVITLHLAHDRVRCLASSALSLISKMFLQSPDALTNVYVFKQNCKSRLNVCVALEKTNSCKVRNLNPQFCFTSFEYLEFEHKFNCLVVTYCINSLQCRLLFITY